MTGGELDRLVEALRDADRAHRATRGTVGSLWGDAAAAIDALRLELAEVRATIDDEGCDENEC